MLVGAILFLCGASTFAAQTSATLGVGASIVEYDGFLRSGAATVTPTLQFDTRRFSIGGQGNWTVFESGNQIFQATAGAGWLTPAREHWRVELAGAAGASKYADEPGSGHLLARSRLHFFAERYGASLGASAGATFDTSTVTPFELTIGAWTARERITLAGTVTTTWLGDDHYVEIAGAATLKGKRVEAEVRIGTRPWAQSGGNVAEPLTGVWGELSALIPLTAQISLALSGGDYPSDPVRRVLGAQYIAAGFRIALFGADASPISPLPAAITSMRTPIGADSTAQPRLEIARLGAYHALRLYVTGATSVEIMGDFTDWQAVSLTPAGGGIWEIQRSVAPGVHRFNIRIDGGDWLVPRGARSEQDEFGGVVGVVVIQ
jgi:hypothetical protein